MDKQQLLKALNLDENANADSLKQAYEAKQTELDSKIEQAPTDALKQKFAQIKLQLQDAYTKHTQTQAVNPLSQTQMADLPQAGMSYTGYEDSALPGEALKHQLKPGTELAGGRYQIKEQIGVGGMGAVFRAFDKNRAQDIAIKVLLPHLTKHERARERFLNEARLSSQLSHPNIVNVFDVQNDGDLYYLTMELLEGQDLRQVMENKKLVRQPFDIEDIKDYVGAICEALEHAHEVTVHRDIKPENIWIGADGKVKLMDFGIAQLQSASQRTKTGAAMGTAYYMAPEQLKGLNDIDGRADQYAVGVLAYELLTGEVPAGVIEPVQELRKGIPMGMAKGVMKALSSRPENRFSSIQELGKQLVKSEFVAPKPAFPTQKSFAIVGGVIAFLIVIALFNSGEPTKPKSSYKSPQTTVKKPVVKKPVEKKPYPQFIHKPKRANETPNEQLTRAVNNLCQATLSRVRFVQRGWDHHVKTGGQCMNKRDYDTHSTPGRDKSLKDNFENVFYKYKDIKRRGVLNTVSRKNRAIVENIMRIDTSYEATDILNDFCPIEYRTDEYRIRYTINLATFWSRLKKGQTSSHPNDHIGRRWGERISQPTRCQAYY